MIADSRARVDTAVSILARHVFGDPLLDLNDDALALAVALLLERVHTDLERLEQEAAA